MIKEMTVNLLINKKLTFFLSRTKI